MGPEGHLEAATDAARRWLALVPSPYADHLPPAIELLAVRAQAVARGAIAMRPARARIRTKNDGWLMAHADLLRGESGTTPKTVVTIKPADRADLLPLALDLHGLTPREREVTTLMLAAYDTEAIARRLSVSPHTVRDHVKSVLAKLDVSSRLEATALLGGAVA